MKTIPVLPGLIIGALLFGLTACAPVANPPPAAPLPFLLVTEAPNPTPTPTPFQPSSGAEAAALFAEMTPQTATPSPTPPPLPEATATPDVNALFPTQAAPPVAPNEQPTALPPLSDNDTVNFLLIGSDKRPGSSFRTDTLLVAILWPRQAQVSLISIPRDLWIYIPTVGMQRINTAYQSGELSDYPGGGPGLLKDTIAYNLGIRIDHTAMVDFNGFRNIVDTLGGIDVPVACAYTDWRLIDPSYDPYNENNWWLYTVGPGLVHMDGDLALWYARSRLKSNDFDRGRRQQETLRALFNRILQTDTLSKIPQLYNDLSSAVVTDLRLSDMLNLAPYLPRLSNATIRSYYIRPPYVSSWTTPGGAAVLLPNEEALRQLLNEALTLSTTTIQRQTITIEIQNGTPFEGWEALAASRLNYAGYQTRISPADKHDYSTSVLIDLTAGQDPNQRTALLAILGLNSANPISLPDPNSPVQYRLILGFDYEPCFRPEELSH
jgi:LCP family protein required for cell wall assembly